MQGHNQATWESRLICTQMLTRDVTRRLLYNSAVGLAWPVLDCFHARVPRFSLLHIHCIQGYIRQLFCLCASLRGSKHSYGS
jgi:hypothetical protein